MIRTLLRPLVRSCTTSLGSLSPQSSSNEEERKSAKLKVVPVPVGNWLDLTPAAYSALCRADVIFCEDTRVTGNMFKALREKRIRQQLQQFCGMSLQTLPQFAEEGQGQQDMFEKFNKLDKRSQSLFFSSLSRQEYLRFKYQLIQHKRQKLLWDLEQFNSSASRTTQRVLETRLRRGRGLLIPLTPANLQTIKERAADLIREFKTVLVCDRGVPGISDPGQQLTRVLPGRVEFVSGGGVLSMVLAKKGVFRGFSHLPSWPRDQPLIFFQNATRILRRLTTLGNSKAWICCQLTKVHQLSLIGEAEVLAKQLKEQQQRGGGGLRGQIVGVVFAQEGKKKNTTTSDQAAIEVRVMDVVKTLQTRFELRESEMSLVVSRILGLSVNRSRQFVRRYRNQAQADYKSKQSKKKGQSPIA